MQIKISSKFLERLAFLLIFFGSIHRVFLGGSIFIYPDTFREVFVEVIIWIIGVGIFFFFMRRDEKFSKLFLLSRLNWPVLGFLGIATLSLVWTVNIPITLYKVITLIFATLAAAYVGVSLNLGQFLNKLAFFSAVVAGLSLALAILLPNVGIHKGYPYFGAWDGIFWARGRLGSFMAFANLVFLFQVARFKGQTKPLLMNAFFYLLTLMIVYLTHSATSIILVILLHISFVIAWFWRNYRNHLTKFHYFGFGILALLGVFAVLTNLSFLFGLLGRETSLTGRVPLWQYLLGEVFVKKPLLGYGFATLWEYGSFRFDMQSVIGWGFPVLISDNGFLDILLNLGVVGLFSFLVVFVLTFVRSFRYALMKGSILHFFPLLLMVYTLILNTTYSHFFELEFFVWFLVTSVLFLTTPLPEYYK